ncbi:D-alanyl-D-alanine carboxypeptidase family protein [Paucibacter sp. APW11]|uniref:D-alanyl-D-alanine carboxypeptidase family protein n=1 Tax=Roseateles aquae TaxID=3077235 RepID=A0ABU3PGU5_9BURK|nr:D-alanyl-D-alanine carboxypeptidase family protein [Paucibacter sp. APW11]MDT9001751.1 D-alanyl-D-alanine carboxypeptidase family protein [Paucibacter sp. APW11]
MTAATYEVLATGLNLRDQPGLQGRVLTVLDRGQIVIASAPEQDGWMPVSSGGISGFAAAKFLRSVAEASPQAGAATTVDVNLKDRDLSRLHPEFRTKVEQVLQRCQDEGIPFRVFEAYRSPERQAWLYEQGRTRMTGGIVTNARAWASFHQYGLAVDFVLFEAGQWSWDDTGARALHWRRLKDLVQDAGLRSLSFETPHAEWPVSLASLQSGNLPADGDATWFDTLEAAVARWQDRQPSAPQVGRFERPALAT